MAVLVELARVLWAVLRSTGYIYQKTKEGTIKFDDIVGNVKSLYKNPQYKDYELYVTGHRYATPPNCTDHHPTPDLVASKSRRSSGSIPCLQLGWFD